MYVFINKKSYKQGEKHWKNGRYMYIGLRGELLRIPKKFFHSQGSYNKILNLSETKYTKTSDTYNAFASANESLKTKTLAFIVVAG